MGNSVFKGEGPWGNEGAWKARSKYYNREVGTNLDTFGEQKTNVIGFYELPLPFGGCELASSYRSQKGMLYLPASSFKILFLLQIIPSKSLVSFIY